VDVTQGISFQVPPRYLAERSWEQQRAAYMHHKQFISAATASTGFIAPRRPLSAPHRNSA